MPKKHRSYIKNICWISLEGVARIDIDYLSKSIFVLVFLKYVVPIFFQMESEKRKIKIQKNIVKTGNG